MNTLEEFLKGRRNFDVGNFIRVLNILMIRKAHVIGITKNKYKLYYVCNLNIYYKYLPK